MPMSLKLNGFWRKNENSSHSSFFNKFFPFLTDCGASWLNTLRRARPQFWQNFFLLGSVSILPPLFLMITALGGLGLVTCSDDVHCKGTKMSCVRIPVNTVLGHVPPRHSKNPAAAVPFFKKNSELES